MSPGSDDLSLGPIDRLAGRSRERWVADMLGHSYGELCSRADDFWAEATSSNVSPVVWVCRHHALEMSGFLEFIRRSDETTLRVIDATDVVLPKMPLGKAHLWSLGLLTPKQIVEADLLARKTSLSLSALSEYRALWDRLRAENAPFRVVDGTGLRSAPINHFDEAIMARVAPDWRVGARIVGDAMAELIDRPFSQCPGDMVIWARVLELAEMGRVEIDGPGPAMRDHRVRLATATS